MYNIYYILYMYIIYIINPLNVISWSGWLALALRFYRLIEHFVCVLFELLWSQKYFGKLDGFFFLFSWRIIYLSKQALPTVSISCGRCAGEWAWRGQIAHKLLICNKLRILPRETAFVAALAPPGGSKWSTSTAKAFAWLKAFTVQAKIWARFELIQRE